VTADDRQITQLLKRWSNGDDAAFAALAPLVYDELRKLAANAFRQERSGHTLQATAVVHEAYLQLVNASVDWDSRAHFYALAARMMRRILLNHATAKAAEKRGGDVVRVTFDEATVRDKTNAEDVIDLDRALSDLAREDQRMADIVELHYFAGMTYKEAGTVLEVSEATAKRALRFGKAWIANHLERNAKSSP